MRRPASLTQSQLAGAAMLVAAVAIVVALVGAVLLGVAMGRPVPVTLDAVSVSATEYAFAPDPLRLPARTPVSLTLRNLSDAPHTLIFLDPIDVQTTAALEAGESTRLQVVTPAPGSYGFVCNVHEGMSGTLIVE